jgi:hypothetical protein
LPHFSRIAALIVANNPIRIKRSPGDGGYTRGLSGSLWGEPVTGEGKPRHLRGLASIKGKRGLIIGCPLRRALFSFSHHRIERACYCGCAGSVTGGVCSGGMAGGVCSGTVVGGVAVVSVGGVAGSDQTTSSAMTTAAAMMSNVFLSIGPCSPAIKVTSGNPSVRKPPAPEGERNSNGEKKR